MLSVCGHETLMEISSPGKSGSLLFRSKDDRFVIKTLRQSEVKVLCEMLPNYLRHVEQYGASLLIKLYGLHAVRPIGGLKVNVMKLNFFDAFTVRVYFVVMENVLQSDLYIHRCYDLKGSSQGRTISKAEDHDRATFKDLDLDFLFYLEPLTRHKLLAQIKNDCKFLEDQGIMDYSLLLGMHIKDQSQGPFCSPASSNNTTHSDRPDAKFGVKMPARAVRVRRNGKDDMALNQEVEGECCNVLLCFGIIDILQGYNMRKRIEHACKAIQYDSVSISAGNHEGPQSWTMLIRCGQQDVLWQPWKPHIDLWDSHFLALTAAEHQFLESEYDDYGVANSSLTCIRSVAIIVCNPNT
ncbi:Phosphatidylinositol 4-phosphate 5-kinase 2 [Camellia lanceoleosa]|uniref:Phosphatidylinositol 4-phosphate 5-kinase 2 n=1 Tax=Camellia lanceoleosa TaxID=1840588 RepID=A0ACC0IA50_9ERIC|nr:Phosphatidylinositol 4-phosphate 5-kinase 2 [Camellia lanceoleosa]